jgi:4'-phosphopantetheinyl transferase
MTLSQQLWLEPPARPALTEGEAHVWRSYLDQDRPTVQALLEFLSPDEQARAGRFYFQKDREHFIVARGVLRVILGRYLNLAPWQLRFAHNQYGKPALSREVDDGRLRFNVSHSHGLALFALTSGRDIGVDLERVRADFASLELAQRFFSPVEVAALQMLSPAAQIIAFFNCWTRKEAYIKARGEGLSYQLHRFTVSLGDGEPALLSTDDEPGEAARWSLIELYPAEDYRAALAVEGARPLLRCWQVSRE